MMKLPKIEALDLRSLDVIVAERNAKGGLQLRVWKPDFFYAAMHERRIMWSANGNLYEW